MTDTTSRTLAKTISWRLTGSSATFLVSYAIVGDISLSSSIAMIQLVCNTILYFFHERIWNRIRWGLNKNTGL